MIKLNDVYNNWITGDGVFTDLNALDVPWKEENNVTPLNMSYHGNHSGDKYVSPIVYKFMKSEVEQPRAKIANVIYTMYHDKWDKLWNAFFELEYNPLNNYDMTETETPAEITHTITPAETTTTETPAETTRTITPAETTTTETPAETTRTITPAETTTTDTPAETTETTKPPKTTTENEVSAFNSVSYVDNTKSTTTGDSTDKGTSVLTVDSAGSTSIDVDSAGSEVLTVDSAGSTSIDVDSAGSEVLTVNSSGSTSIDVDNAGSDVLTVQNARELTRSGNIGVMSSQNLLESEVKLRKWLFYQEVFNDIDNVLTLSIY